jgi:hypothetical protein
MYTVSSNFIEKIRASKRQVLAKAVIDYTDPFMDQSIEIETSEQANVSYPQQTADSVQEATHKWASLDGSWTLDGTYHLAPPPEKLAQFQFGWWGKQLAGTNGAFVSPYPALTVTHFPRPIHTLRVVGDTAREEWPVDFTIRLYDPDDTLLYTETVTGNNQVNWQKTLEPPVLDVAKQVLEITKWSHAGRCAKIIEFFTSIREIYETGDLISIRLLEEREASQGSLPVGSISANEIMLVLNNELQKFDVDNDQSPLKNLLKPNRRIQVWLGAETSSGEEWVPLGTFWSLDWDAPDDTLEATVTARDRMELLRKGTYQSSQVQENKSLYELAEAVLQDAGLNSNEYIIDAALQLIIIPYAWFNPVSHREALRLIAEAGLAVAYADRTNKIRITLEKATLSILAHTIFLHSSFPIETTSPDAYGIGPDDYFLPLRSPSKQSEVANEIIVDTQPLRPATAAEEVYRSNEPMTIPASTTKTITAFYNKTPVIEAIASLDSPPAGVSITDVSYYGWGASVKIRNTNDTDKQVTLVIQGKPLTVQNKERAIARDEANILENGVLRYEFPANPLVQTLDQAQAIADALLASAKDPRRDIEFEWRGNPALELGDVISVLTNAERDRRIAYSIIRQEIEWAGALSAKLTGRRVVE